MAKKIIVSAIVKNAITHLARAKTKPTIVEASVRKTTINAIKTTIGNGAAQIWLENLIDAIVHIHER